MKNAAQFRLCRICFLRVLAVFVGIKAAWIDVLNRMLTSMPALSLAK